jgi:hypothetical protein
MTEPKTCEVCETREAAQILITADLIGNIGERIAVCDRCRKEHPGYVLALLFGESI